MHVINRIRYIQFIPVTWKTLIKSTIQKMTHTCSLDGTPSPPPPARKKTHQNKTNKQKNQEITGPILHSVFVTFIAYVRGMY